MSEGDTKKTGPASGQAGRAKKEAGTDEHAEAARGSNEAATGKPSEGAGGEEEVGGPQGPEPTRFGDWERKGRCIDF
ncbi:MAG: DUF1674 domain-containing protein [Rhodospirillales bacterium]|nr:DUF1674 domain-containing protein [Rhodospirillales bacterium]